MILRLACLQIQSHRLRTMFVAVAGVLTSILYMTVLSISYCILDSSQLSMMLAAGSDFHASVSETGYSLSGETLRREIQDSPEVSEAFLLGMGSAFSTDAAYTSRENQGMDIVFTDSGKILSHLFMTPTEGKFPKSTDEIMLYEGAFSSLSVGDHVQITYDCPNGETEEKSYTVSGFYNCDADRPIPAVTLYDGDTAWKLDLAAHVMIRFHSSFGIDRYLDAVTEHLEEWELPGAVRDSQINYAYAAADFGEFFKPGSILLIICVVAIVFFAAFLLIYNIFSISLAQDMRTFGLLRVIGTTHRQMKKLTYVQIILIGCVALPIGLLLGYFIGFKFLSPVFMSLSGTILPYRFSAWIVLISAGLTLFTLFFSALRPLKRIKKMTPVQSVSAEPEEDCNQKERRREIYASPRSLALAGIRRSRGRMLITSLSAMVSVLLFVIVGGLVDGFIGSTLDRLGRFDIDLTLKQVENSGGISTVPPSFESPSFRAAIEPDVMEKLASSDAVNEIYLLRFERIRAEIPPVLEEKIQVYLGQQKNEFVSQEYKDILDSGLINAVVLGIPDELCQYIVVSQEAGKTVYFNEEDELCDGCHILYISTPDNGQSFSGIRLFTGDMLSSDALEMNYEVIGAELQYGIYTALRQICSYTYIPGGFSGEDALFLLPMSVFEKEFPDAPVFTVLANAKENMDEILLEEVQKCTDGRGVDINGVSYDYRTAGKLNQLADLQVRLAALRLTGYSLCGIIFLIGLLNMVNSALTSMVLRRREFAMLETVGMTRAQLRRMLLYENSAGGVFGLASFVVGSVLSSAMLTQTFGVDVAPISLPAIGILLFLFAAGGVTAELSYRMLTKTSLNERVRFGE